MAEPAFERAGARTLVGRGPTNIGIVDVGGGRAVLVDSGPDAAAGLRALAAAEAEGLSACLVANTHSHSDHCGGNAAVQARAGCGVAAPRVEASFVERPLLEPSSLWGGFPLPALRNRFLAAEPSRVTLLLDPPCELADTGIRVVALPGHSFGMVGYLTPDGVFFAGDAVAAPEILESGCVFFLYDVEAYLACLDELERIEARLFVASHAPPTEDIRPLAAYMRRAVEEATAFIAGACAEPSTAEELLAKLATRYRVSLNHTQYVLLGFTLRSCLAWLAGKRIVSSRVEGGRMLFEGIA